METLSMLLTLLIGLVLRLALPIALTIFAIYSLRKLDARWQAEAGQQPPKIMIEKPKCWEMKECPAKQRQACAVFTSSEPCWQIWRTHNGYLRAECLACQVFTRASIPVRS